MLKHILQAIMQKFDSHRLRSKKKTMILLKTANQKENRLHGQWGMCINLLMDKKTDIIHHYQRIFLLFRNKYLQHPIHFKSGYWQASRIQHHGKKRK